MIRDLLARAVALGAAVVTLLAGGSALAQTTPPPPRVLVLYDQPAGSPYEKLGLAYAIMLRNLLGHFNATVDLVPVDQYSRATGTEAHDATFYLGAIYDNPMDVPGNDFLADAAATTRPLVWFRYNIWQLAWNAKFPLFQVQKGFSLQGLAGMNADATPTNPKPGFFDTVQYKNPLLQFVKYYAYDAVTDTINADPDVGVVTVTDATKASVPATISNPQTGQSAPYVLRSGNFWYVADMPFSYIGPRDRYLVIADLLHDMLGINHAERHLALVRLEDVGASVSVQTIRTLTDYLRQRRIPFGLAVIPHYRDPKGTYNGGVPQDVPFSQAANLRRSLDYALQRGGEVWMHGFTHQLGNNPNPFTGVSGEDFEFWDAVLNMPVAAEAGQSSWALARINQGLAELTANANYTPVGWETPHYIASATTSRLVGSGVLRPFGNRTHQRVVYFTADLPNFAAATGRDFAVGQFYPYIVEQDHYGQRVIPENLGNIEYLIPGDPASTIVYTADDLLLNADFAKVVRDGFGAFFFHPFLLEPDVNLPGFADFSKVVDGLTARGYTWTRASTVR